MYVYSTQIHSRPQTWSHFFVLPPPKKFFFIIPWWVFIFDLEISTNKARISTQSGKSGNLLEDQEKLEKNVYPCTFLTFKKNHMHAEMCAVGLYMTISCIYDAIYI